MKSHETSASSWLKFAVAALSLTQSAATRAMGQLGGVPPAPWDFRDAIAGPGFGMAPPRVARSYDGPKDLCIASTFMPHDAKAAELATDNHRRYAERHGYKYVAIEGRLSGPRLADLQLGRIDSERGGGLPWQKLPLLQAVAAQQDAHGAPACAWTFYIDPDAIVTNPQTTLEEVLQTFAADTPGGVSKDLLLARDDSNLPGTLINSGVFFVRNSPGGNAFFGRGKPFIRCVQGQRLC